METITASVQLIGRLRLLLLLIDSFNDVTIKQVFIIKETVVILLNCDV